MECKVNIPTILGYKYHDRPARCNYYALEYRNRIYHVFNAYNYVKIEIFSQLGKWFRR